MKRSLLTIAIMALGIALIAWSLYAPLVTIPVVGSVNFSTAYFGGKGLIWTILVLLILATPILSGRGSIQRFGWLLGGSGMGLLAGSLLGIYRGLLDQIQQLSDAGGHADVQLLLDKAQIANGMIVLGAGIVIWLAGASFSSPGWHAARE